MGAANVVVHATADRAMAWWASLIASDAAIFIHWHLAVATDETPRHTRPGTLRIRDRALGVSDRAGVFGNKFPVPLWIETTSETALPQGPLWGAGASGPIQRRRA
jgi:hypothetical protein